MNPTACDLLITGASVIDGSGAPGFAADVAVLDDRIVAIGDLARLPAGRRIDGTGRVLAPGFIDAHCHDDRALISMPLLEPKVSQGVTTVVNGNCGVSIAPMPASASEPPQPISLLSRSGSHFFPTMQAYLDHLDADPAAVNSVCLTGHTSLRYLTMDRLDRAASAQEISAMQAALAQALQAGSIGLSSGLFYPPAKAAPATEMQALAKILGDYGRLYTSHMRDEGDDVQLSLQETFEVGRSAGIGVIVSHHKCVGKNNHGRSLHTLEQITRASAEQAVGLDAYPYVASSTMLDPNRVEHASRVIVTWSETMPEMSGRDLSDIARTLGCSDIEAARRLTPAGATYFILDEADVQRILAFPNTMIGSDGICEDRHPHPRAWGTFARVLGHYARDLALFPLAEAVRKMTSLPAQQFGLKDRGTVRQGAYADLVLFDPQTIIDNASFDSPRQPASGIDKVIVNGRLVFDQGQSTGARPGKALRH